MLSKKNILFGDWTLFFLRKNDLQLYKTISKKPRLLKVAELIKRTLAEIFVSQNFTDYDGKSFLIFIRDVELSKDAKIATVFLKNFSKKKILAGPSP